MIERGCKGFSHAHNRPPGGDRPCFMAQVHRAMLSARALGGADLSGGIVRAALARPVCRPDGSLSGLSTG